MYGNRLGLACLGADCLGVLWESLQPSIDAMGYELYTHQPLGACLSCMHGLQAAGKCSCEGSAVQILKRKLL